MSRGLTKKVESPPMWLVAGFLVLLVNTAYLAAYATPSLVYFANVGAHVVLGVVLAIGFLRWLGRRRPVAAWLLVSAALLLAGALFGLAVVHWGATRPYRWILHAHIGLSTAGALLLVGYLAVVFWRLPQGRWRTLALASVALVVGAVAWSVGLRAGHDEARAARHRIVNPTTVPLGMEEEGAGPRGPFFPSSAETDVGGIIPADFFLTSQGCGRCHADIYDQWNSSAHHFSSFNNQWYRKSVEYMQDVVGTRPSKWCAGCHDHAVFFNGRFDRPIKEQIDTPEAQAGLACTSCHAVTHVKSSMGQGDFVIEYPPLHDLATSEDPTFRYLHDKLLAIDPQPHRETFLKPFHREQTAEFCSSCHKVHLDVPVNDYRWFRGFNDYDNWQASGVSGQGARSFYYPAAPQKCADCHMPLVPSNDPAARDGKVRSHRFPGANTALPFVNRDAVQLETVQKFLRDGQISVDVFGLVRGAPAAESMRGQRPATSEQAAASTFAVGEESMNYGASHAVLLAPADVLAPLDRVDAVVRRGESVRLEVVVRTRKVGHFFPGGTVDAFDVWVELEAVDDRGRVIFHSGQVADEGRGPVEPGAHFYRSLLLDERGNPINKRNAFAARSVAYVRLIPPGAADTVHYRLQVPPDAGDRIVVRAKVKYRKFAWWNTQWAYAGIRDPSHTSFGLAPGYDDGRWLFSGDTSKVSGQVREIPDIPTTIMAEAETTLRVAAANAALEPDAPYVDRTVRERWTDYGIGLLLQGDIKGAEAAFLKVTRMDPEYADGWVNVGRARVQEGDMSAADAILRQALKVNPRLASAHFFLGLALKSLGRYEEALEHLRTAADQYPRDRVVRNQLGRVLFLQRRFGESVEELKKVLEVDPEDLQAHYNLMLAYQGLGESALAGRERTLYERFKADESSQAITGPYRQLHPDDNNERQQIHEHRSVGETVVRPPARRYDVVDSAGGAANP